MSAATCVSDLLPLCNARNPAAGGEDHGDDSKMLRNQFNYSERAAQTVNNPLRNRECSTEPPPTLTFSETTTQYAIFDWYMEDQERQRQQKEMAAASARRAREQGDKKTEEVAAEPAAGKDGKDSLSSRGGMARATKVLERMVNQNTYDEIALDFKYWEDASDSFREGEGTLLPLWKFYNDRAKRKHVTALCWCAHAEETKRLQQLSRLRPPPPGGAPHRITTSLFR